jgi:hypothetical protein
MTGFSTAAALADALDALSEAADALSEAADELAALDALPDPLEHATMNSANIAANTTASRALNFMLPFIVFLPSRLTPKRCDPLHRFVTVHIIPQRFVVIKIVLTKEASGKENEK